MTHRDKSAVRGLIEEVLAAGGEVDHGDAMRRCWRLGCRTDRGRSPARLGACRYERAAERVTHRNGTRAKLFTNRQSRSSWQSPSCEGSFFPSLLEPRRRIDQALWATIAQAWIQGVSTQRVDQLVKALGNETRMMRIPTVTDPLP